MKSIAGELEEAKAALPKDLEPPHLGMVLGSGLRHLSERIEVRHRIPLDQIPHMPRPRVEGHGGELVFGMLAGRPLVCSTGRVHLYEGHSPQKVVFTVRLMSALGVRAVLLTNAAGGIRSDLTPGSLMVLSDHLNLTWQNCLVGDNDVALGPRFPDMSEIYDRSLQDALVSVGRDLAVPVSRGVYAGLLGPSFETPAEIRMLRHLGADAVGMSTVLEAIALRHQGTRVAAISCITNLAAGLSPTPLSHEEVSETAARASQGFQELLIRFVATLSL